MARGHPNILVRILDAALRLKGFTRHKKSWHFVKPETVLVVDLWKSPWSSDYIIDLGVSIRQCSSTLTPRAAECHISHRLASLVAQYNEFEISARERDAKPPAVRHLVELLPPKFKFIGDPIYVEAPRAPMPHIDKALDLDDELITDADRTATITTALIEHGLPFLDAWDSLAKIRQLLSERGNRFARNTAVWGAVYKLFALPIPDVGQSPG